MGGGGGVLGGGGGHHHQPGHVVLGDGVDGLGAGAAPQGLLLLEEWGGGVVGLGRGLLGGGAAGSRRLGRGRQQKVVLFQLVLAENWHRGFDTGKKGHLLPATKKQIFYFFF